MEAATMSAGWSGPGARQVAFAATAVLAAVLDAAILALAPLLPQTPGGDPHELWQPQTATQATEPPAPLGTSVTTTVTTVTAVTTVTSMPVVEQPTTTVGVAPKKAAAVPTEGALVTALRPLAPSSLRLLPDAQTVARAPRFWLVFGLSSVYRAKAEYLGLTLSHLFSELPDPSPKEQSTAIVAHLADFDETWVERTQRWLNASFTDEIAAGRLHAIHAPKRLYPSRENASKLLKYGDALDRQWWRAKQNLDYAFLMWYCADLADYYMQLEDDVQIVPNFLKKVSDFLDAKVLGTPWIMVAFSKLGFIGKFFNSSHVQGLAEFLFVFYDEAPCDWLVWVYIDVLSSQPVSSTIAEDLEKESTARENHGRDPTVRLPGSMRTDVALFYKEGPPEAKLFSTVQRPTATKPPPNQAAPIAVSTPSPEIGAGAAVASWSPLVPGRAWSSMKPWNNHTPAHALAPSSSELVGFWTSDTCAPDPQRVRCDATTKFIEVRFNEVLVLQSVKIQMGNPGHPHDFVHDGVLEAFADPGCTKATKLSVMKDRNVVWQGTQVARCLRVRLLGPQKEWLLLRFASINWTLPKEAAPPLALPSGLAVPTRKLATEAQHTAVPPQPAALPTQPTSPPTAAASRLPGLQRQPQTPVVTSSLGGSGEEEAALRGLLAASLGFAAGLAGWVAVCAAWRVSAQVLEVVGGFTCWLLSFVVVLDALVLLTLRLPSPPPVLTVHSSEATLAQPRAAPTLLGSVQLPGASAISSSPTRAPAVLTPAPTPAPSLVPTPATTVPQRNVPAAPAARAAASDATLVAVPAWHELRPRSRLLDAASLQAMRILPSSQAVALPGGNSSNRSWMAVGLVAGAKDSHETVADSVGQFLEAGDGQMVVVLYAREPAASRRAVLLDTLSSHLPSHVAVGRLQVMHAPVDLCPLAPQVLLLLFAAPLADYYVQAELDSHPRPQFLRTLKTYVEGLTDPSWHMVSLSKLGVHRKVLKTWLLPRFAELLAMFPEVPPDALLWDFLDIVGNQSAPKSCFLATSATRKRRPDVVLQYHKSEALIEHVGDASSLPGKVQHIHDTYFKTHKLESALFDNPPATMRTSIHAKGGPLQMVYGFQGAGGPRHPTFQSAGVVGSSASDLPAFIEVIFSKPRDVEILLLRMGGIVLPPKKGQDPNLASLDFNHTLEGADLHFGRGGTQADACDDYEHVDKVGGREVFWRSPQSRPATGVRCIRVAAQKPQQTPLVVRGLCVRTTGARRATQGMAAQAAPASAPALSAAIAGQRPRTPAPLVAAQPVQSSEPSSAVVSSSTKRIPVSTRGPVALRASVTVLVPTIDPMALERWDERHMAWALTISVAFGAGSLAGALGAAVLRLVGVWSPETQGRRRERSRRAA